MTAALVAAAGACSSGGPAGFEESTDSGGAPHYDGSAAQDGAGDTAPGTDATHDGPVDAGGGDAEASEAAQAQDASEGGVEPEAAAEAASGHEVEPEASVPEAGAEAAVEASAEAATEASVEASVEAGAEAASDASGDAASESSSTQDAGTDSATDANDAAQEAGTIVPPVCDGVVSAAEYGGTSNEASSTGGQTWYATWDDTNLYVAIANASIYEGMVVYVAIAPGTDAGPAGQLTIGQAYDNTDATTLPFAADLVVYAKDGYTEARTASSGAWGSPQQTSVVQCDNGTTMVREEVIPWSLVGGRPASFGWLGYVAAPPGSNPQGFIYGQMPTGNPTGSPASNATFTQYYEIDSASATPTPFADVQ